MSLGFGPLLAFEVQGGPSAAEAVVNAFQLVRHAPSLGGVETLSCLPASTSHIQLGPDGRATRVDLRYSVEDHVAERVGTSGP